MNGYSDRLIAIDDEMAALGRPPPPVVSWISRDTSKAHAQHIRNKPDECPCAWCLECRGWRKQLEAWEETNPESAIKWHELRERYITQERDELKARYSQDAWNYVLLDQLGVPETNLDLIRRKFDDNGSMRAARDWMVDVRAWCLVLIGGTGCGKSTAAAWAAHQRLMRNFGVQWVDCVKQCEAPMYGVAAEHRRWQCRTTHTLVLDDLGSGRRERESDFWLAWLDDVIGSRANDNKRTIVTTNRTVAELGAWLGPRLVDRLNAGTIVSTSEKSMRGQSQHTAQEMR